jgi:hypothetical protein
VHTICKCSCKHSFNSHIHHSRTAIFSCTNIWINCSTSKLETLNFWCKLAVVSNISQRLFVTANETTFVAAAATRNDTSNRLNQRLISKVGNIAREISPDKAKYNAILPRVCCSRYIDASFEMYKSKKAVITHKRLIVHYLSHFQASVWKLKNESISKVFIRLTFISVSSSHMLVQILHIYPGCGRDPLYLLGYIHHPCNGVGFSHNGTTILVPFSPHWLFNIQPTSQWQSPLSPTST